jgi:hypothetical protein
MSVWFKLIGTTYQSLFQVTDQTLIGSPSVTKVPNLYHMQIPLKIFLHKLQRYCDSRKSSKYSTLTRPN